jgi:hypothetical protein
MKLCKCEPESAQMSAIVNPWSSWSYGTLTAPVIGASAGLTVEICYAGSGRTFVAPGSPSLSHSNPPLSDFETVTHPRHPKSSRHNEVSLISIICNSTDIVQV